MVKLENKKVIKENFKTLVDMVNTMENRPLNKAFEGSTPSSENKDHKGRFTGVETYEECKEVLQSGYTDPLEQMKKAILKIGQKNNHVKPKLKTDVVGFVPHVPNTIMNLPQTMLNRNRTPLKNKTIHLTYGFTASGSVGTSDLIKGGVHFISLVNSLEKQGYRVKIDFLFASVSDKSVVGYTVNLKRYDQNLNLLKLTFPLVHPSMLRRISFKWLETLTDLKDKDYVYGYGTPLIFSLGENHKREREYLKENKFITGENHYYVSVYEAFRSKDIEELAKRIDLV